MTYAIERAVADGKRIRFGQYSFILLSATFVLAPLAVVTPFAIVNSRLYEGVVGVVCLILLYWSFIMWRRLFVRVVFPTLEIGTPSGVVKFDLRESSTSIAMKNGVLIVANDLNRHGVRAWAADGQRTGKNGFCHLRFDRLAAELARLTRAEDGADLRYTKQPSAIMRFRSSNKKAS